MPKMMLLQFSQLSFVDIFGASVALAVVEDFTGPVDIEDTSMDVNGPDVGDNNVVV